MFQIAESSTRSGSPFTVLNYTEWFKTTTSGSCEKIWTPLTDEEEEGVFVNLENGIEADFLPWLDGQPNSGSLQNSVTIWPGGGNNPYIDVSPYDVSCSWCNLKVDLILSLRGVCKDTFMGK